MDDKAKKILEHYRKVIEDEKFDEYDILGFLIFIRSYLDKNMNIIREFSDLVAHRERNKEIVMTNIRNTIINRYAYDENLNKVIGYSGISQEEWKNEWYKVGKIFNITLNEKIIKEITLCIYSLAQKTKYEDRSGNVGYIEFLAQSKFNNIGLATTEGRKDSLYICFTKYKGFNINENYDGIPIKNIIYTKRKNGKLQLLEGNNIITEV